MPIKNLYWFAVLFLPLAACAPSNSVSEYKEDPSIYTAPDTVGTLGGQQVRLSDYQTDGATYEDTPSAFDERWKTYKSPPRTLESKLEDLWIYVNLETGKINDLRKTSVDGFLNERDQPNTPWVSIRMVGLDFQPGEDWLDKDLESDLKGMGRGIERHGYKETNNTKYSLQIYANDGVDSVTGHSSTVYIARNVKGHVRTHIRCFNGDVPNPPCEHEYFISLPNKRIVFYISYNRNRLKDWRRIEDLAKHYLDTFIDNAKHPKRKI